MNLGVNQGVNVIHFISVMDFFFVKIFLCVSVCAFFKLCFVNFESVYNRARVWLLCVLGENNFYT